MTCMYLGPQDTRTQSKSRGEDGQVVGGIAFERTGVHPVRENTRAYSISTLYEKLMSIVAPCKNAKYYGEVTDRLELCSGMVFVSFCMTVTYCVIVVLMLYVKASTELMSESLNFLPHSVTDPIKMQVNILLKGYLKLQHDVDGVIKHLSDVIRELNGPESSDNEEREEGKGHVSEDEGNRERELFAIIGEDLHITVKGFEE